ncbi:MAG: hypothetical protein JO157_09360 [Acetobacteraceae bacterium]|nr:hypothetical protein [Acetobacteraceae bacterium]
MLTSAVGSGRLNGFSANGAGGGGGGSFDAGANPVFSHATAGGNGSGGDHAAEHAIA